MITVGMTKDLIMTGVAGAVEIGFATQLIR